MAADAAPWWRNAVIYQVYPRSFADSNGDGMGDLPGITAHLEHIADLGADAVWLSPIYASPGDDNGYDISDYESIDPMFGTMEDTEALIDRAHALGLKVVMDLVVNHTSDEHEWFTQSRSAHANPKSDWYIWRDPRPGHVGGEPGAEPNNWESFFSGPTWTWVPERQQYYLHLFSSKQPDLNWENPELRAEIYQMMNRWLDRGIDGFRMDVINLISKVEGLPDGELRSSGLGDPMPYVVHGPRLMDFLCELRRECVEGRDNDIVLVGETPAATPAHGRELTDAAAGPLDMVFQFDHVALDHGVSKFDVLPFDVRRLKASLELWQEELGDSGWNSLYFENHDQPRSVSRWGDDGEYWYESATAIATTLHLMRGTPYVYQGQEIGMTNSTFAEIDDFRDLESLRYYRDSVDRLRRDATVVLGGLRSMGRDNARTPMQWSADPQAGFTTGEPWLAANPHYPQINVRDQEQQPHSVLKFYRQLIAMRHSLPVVVDGDFALIDGDSTQTFTYTRSFEDQELLVAVNWSGTAAPMPAVSGARSWSLALTNYADASRSPLADKLRPWESRVLVATVPV